MHLVCRYNFFEARTYQVFPFLASSLNSSSRECLKVFDSKIAKMEQSCSKTEFKIKWSRIINLMSSTRSCLTQVSVIRGLKKRSCYTHKLGRQQARDMWLWNLLACYSFLIVNCTIMIIIYQITDLWIFCCVQQP